MIILLDTGQTIGLVVYILIGLFILAIVIGSITSANARKKSKIEEDKTNDKIEEIIKTNPDALFDLKDGYFSSKRIIFDALDRELIDWDVCKKFSLMKKLGMFYYNDKWSGVESENISFDGYYYLSFFSVLNEAFDRCFKVKEGSRLRQLVDYKEGLTCHLIYKILCDYPNPSEIYHIRDHRGLQQTDALFFSQIDHFIKSGDDPVFEETLKKVYEIIPLKRMFEKDSRYGYCLFRDIIMEIYS